MTPKEKAEYLIKRFEMNNGWGELERGQKTDYALICVYEILETVTTIADKKYDYWIEVKKELESL